MKLAYIANARVPGEKAHSLQLMKMCEAFSNNIDIDVIIPRRINKSKDDPFEYYSIKEKFSIKKVICLDLLWLNIIDPIGFYVQSITFSFFSAVYLLFKKFDIYYTRDIISLFFLVKLNFIKKRKIFLELHDVPNKFLERLLINCFSGTNGIIFITKGIMNHIRTIGYKGKALVSPDGVDIGFFDIKSSKEDSRKKLGIKTRKKIIVYTGHLYKWKGVYVLIDAMRYLRDYVLYLVGGTVDDIAFVKNYIKDEIITNVVVVGYVKPMKVPLYLKSADLLILPNLQETLISKYYTSPLKLFEYMVSKRPIIASDLPSLKEILVDKKNAVLFKPNDPEDLARTIKYTFEDKDLLNKIVKNAFNDVKKYSWDLRVKNIIRFIG